MDSTPSITIHIEMVASIQEHLGHYPGDATDALLSYFQRHRQEPDSCLQDILPIRVYSALTGKSWLDALSLGAIWSLYLATAHGFDEVQDNGNLPVAYAALVAIAVANKIGCAKSMNQPILLEILDAFSSVTILGANAQLQEHNNKQPASEEVYFQRIAGKAGTLISAGVWSAGKLAGLKKSSLIALREFGMAWGMANQISDDCKDIREDLEIGLYTLPIIKGHWASQSSSSPTTYGIFARATAELSPNQRCA